jgi:hypothetical protein
VPFDCYERTEVVGGNWVFGSPASAAYRTLHINSYRKTMEYRDYPMPDSMPDFPGHELIAQYFSDYVDEFGLRDRITFGVAVDAVDRMPDGRWSVRRSDGATRTYDAVLVANGHHSRPRWPDPPYPGRFDGEQMHAHDYRDLEVLRGRRVVVVGMGNSAMDIAVESSYVARRTFLSARRGAYIIPKYIFGRPELPLVGDRRLPWWLRQRLFEAALRVAVGRPDRYGLPRPAHGILQAHPTASDAVLSRLTHGSITPKPAVEELLGDRVRFTDGSVEDVDLVVYCTGYRIDFPFLERALVASMGLHDNDLRLFQRVFSPDVPGLYFIGFVQPWGAIMPLAEAQSRLVAALIAGRYALPSRQRMAAAMAADEARRSRRYVASRRHTIQVDQGTYLHELDRELRAGRRRAGSLDRAGV